MKHLMTLEMVFNLEKTDYEVEIVPWDLCPDKLDHIKKRWLCILSISN